MITNSTTNLRLLTGSRALSTANTHIEHTESAPELNNILFSDNNNTTSKVQYLKTCCLLYSIEEQQADAEANGCYELKNILADIYSEQRKAQSIQLSRLDPQSKTQYQELYDSLQSAGHETQSTYVDKKNLARLQSMKTLVDCEIDINSMAKEISKELIILKQKKLDVLENIIKENISKSIKSEEPQYSKDVADYYLKKNTTNSLKHLIKNKNINDFTRNALKEVTYSNRMRCKEYKFAIEIAKNKQEISSLTKKLTEKREGIKIKMDSLREEATNLARDKQQEVDSLKKNEINKNRNKVVNQLNELVVQYNDFNINPEVIAINKNKDVLIDERNKLIADQEKIRKHLDKSITDCYLKKGAITLDVKDKLAHDFKSVGELTANISQDKIENSRYFEKISHASEIKTDTLKKLNHVISKDIGKLRDTQIKEIDTKIQIQSNTIKENEDKIAECEENIILSKLDEKKIATCKKIISRSLNNISKLDKEKQVIDETIEKIKNDIKIISAAINQEHRDIMHHSTDFLRITRDDATGMLFEKQINNGTCTIHRNNAVISYLTHGSEIEQTPYRLESLITAEMILEANNNISAIIDKVGSNECATLKELKEALNHIKQNEKISETGVKNIIDKGHFMDYYDTLEKNRTIKKNNLNVASTSLFEEHGLIGEKIEKSFTRGSEMNESDLDALKKHDALIITVAGKKEGNDRSHAVSILKKENEYFFMDSNKKPVKSNFDDIFSIFTKQQSDELSSAQLKELHNYYSPYDQLTVRFGFNLLITPQPIEVY